MTHHTIRKKICYEKIHEWFLNPSENQIVRDLAACHTKYLSYHPWSPQKPEWNYNWHKTLSTDFVNNKKKRAIGGYRVPGRFLPDSVVQKKSRKKKTSLLRTRKVQQARKFSLYSGWSPKVNKTDPRIVIKDGFLAIIDHKHLFSCFFFASLVNSFRVYSADQNLSKAKTHTQANDIILVMYYTTLRPMPFLF